VFSGIIQELGRVRSLRRQAHRARLFVDCERVLAGLQPGGSIAVNGVCLTCEETDSRGFGATLLAETLRATNLAALKADVTVNLEPPLRMGDPIGGHFLQGHVDAAVRVISLTKARGGKDAAVVCELPAELRPFVFAGASIGLNGVSLTVRAVEADSFTVNLVAETLARTNLGGLLREERVNCEVDLIIKSVYHSLQAGVGKAELTPDALRRLGYD